MNNETYAYLNQVRSIQKRLEERKMQLEFLESKLMPGALRYDTPKVQTSPSDQMSTVGAEICDVQKEIDALSDTLIAQLHDIESTIDQLENETERTVLKMYYLSCVNVPDIAQTLEYSEQGVYTLRRRGSKKIEKILKIRNNTIDIRCTV